jgi:ectoine hydroxylase-related dioxygenase (phytanoyl-CoA dioxygenase family)
MIDDLSKYHGCVGTLFQQETSASAEDCYRLSDADISYYQRHGYLKGIRVLSAQQIDALNEELSALVDPANPANELFHEFHTNESRDPNSTLFHALGAWRIAPGFHDLLWHPAVTVPAKQLLGGDVRFWHDQLFCKPPLNGGVVAWHQDYSYWTRTTPLAHLTCWIALDDVSIENGCPQYVPGTHRWPDLPITGLTGEMNAIESVLTEEQQREFRPVAIELKRGECSFHHPRLIHGSFENRSPRPRRGTVINMFRDGVVSASDEPLLKGVPVIPRGNRLEGQFFPLLNQSQETRRERI